ncbi:hypothetical protein NDU88_002589 [Pleurodeles waltl]|uniref:Uncharacterized protein n=1 Tax=Pleurodeles waltl TaxID=8319 RepID=A0AAV7UYX6_PLEWA|nr:hypothetical protein NDU88_002589 [Pleurodeles waltl]
MTILQGLRWGSWMVVTCSDNMPGPTWTTLDPDPLVALLGYVREIPHNVRRFTALEIPLAKQEIAIYRGSSRIPTTQAWLISTSSCDTDSEIYVKTLLQVSRHMGHNQELATSAGFRSTHLDRNPLFMLSLYTPSTFFWDIALPPATS